MISLRVLLVGPSSRPEFQPVKASLAKSTTLQEARDLPNGYHLARTKGFLPDLVVLLQAYPAQFSADQLAPWREWVPLCPVIVVLGPWVEGAGRWRHRLPGTWEISWHQWGPRWGQQLRSWQEGKCPLWGMPPTSIEEDRLLAHRPPKPPARGEPIGLCTLRPGEIEWLFTGLKQWGFQPLWIQPGKHFPTPESPCHPLGGARKAPDFLPPVPAREEKQGETPLISLLSEMKIVIFDATDPTAQEELWLQQLARWFPKPRIILLVDFPQPGLGDQLHPLGVEAILAKPFWLGDLVWYLDQLENDNT